MTLLKSVPNQKAYRELLRLVKLWAMRRNIYSHILGYLGGVSYAILAARICQENGDIGVPDLLLKFFETYSEWKWPQPVFLLQRNTKLDVNALKALDTIDTDLMPIVAPAIEPSNSSYRVTISTFNLIMDEFKKASIKAQQILKKEAKWTALFKKARFFNQYNHFLKVDVLSAHGADHPNWLGLVESKLRKLVTLLEDLPELEEVRVLPHVFEGEEPEFAKCNTFYVGLRAEVPGVREGEPPKQVELRGSITSFVNFLDIYRLDKQAHNVRILYKKRSDIEPIICESF